MQGFLAALGTVLVVLVGLQVDATQTYRPLFVAGLLVVLSFFIGEAFGRARLPRAVGCVLVGMVLGPEGFRLMESDVSGQLELLEALALGWVGFRLGVASYGSKEVWRSSVCIAASVVAASFIGTSLVLWVSRVPFTFALLLGTIAAAAAPLVISSMQDHGERRGNSLELSIAICASGLVLLLWIGVMGGLQITHSRWIPATIWIPGLKFIGAVGLAVALSRMFGFLLYRGLFGLILLSVWFIAFHLLLASETALFLFAATMGIALPRGDQEHQKERIRLGRPLAEMAALFLFAFLGARMRFRFVQTTSFLWLAAGIYLATMVGSKVVAIYAGRSMLKTAGLRMRDGAACFLPQLFLPLALIAATEAQLSDVPGFKKLSDGFGHIAYWGVLWGSLIFPIIVRVKREGKATPTE